MRILNRTIYYPSRTDTFRLYFLTDTHVGALACDERLLMSDIRCIRDDPSAFWIGGGDYIDAICRVGDKRYNTAMMAPWLHGKDNVINRQAHYFCDMVEPIADKCLGLVSGNHEQTSYAHYDNDVYGTILNRIARASNRQPKELELDTQGYVNLTFRRGKVGNWGSKPYRVSCFCRHGSGGGRTSGSHANKIVEMLNIYDCVLAFQGHVHTRVFTDKMYVDADGKRQLRMGFVVPSYLNTWIDYDETYTDRKASTYSERAGYPPTHLGTFPVVIKPDKEIVYAILSNGRGIRDILD